MSAIATENAGNRYSMDRDNKGGGKFCKICKDVGKTRAEYTSHYVRETPSPNSRVVCPTLIAAVCRYCKEGGHTVKHCPKIAAKNRQEAKNHNLHIISKSYCMPVTGSKKNTKSSDKKSSVYAVLDFSSDEEEEEEVEDEVVVMKKEEEVVVTPQTTDNVVSYASILKKAPQKSTTPSQIESLIPSKLNFNDEDVVTLDMITKQWADEENLDDAIILRTVDAVPVLFDADHPLARFVFFADSLALDFTKNFSKSIAITSDAFQQLSKNWETKFFEFEGGKKVMDKAKDTNARARSIVLTERYIR